MRRMAPKLLMCFHTGPDVLFPGHGKLIFSFFFLVSEISASSSGSATPVGLFK